MRKIVVTALIVVSSLAAIASAANAERIVTRTLGAETLNITVAGRISFLAGEFRVICNKTMSGHLNETVEGTLGLLRNDAGTIREIRLANCTDPATALVRLEASETWIRLSWLRAPITGVGLAQLAGNNARFLIEQFGVSCLYEASLWAESESDELGNFRHMRLQLLEARLIRDSSGIFRLCPRENISMIGELDAVRPTSVRIRLEA